MAKKQQMEQNEGGMFPVRFDIEMESEEQTKKVQGLFQVKGKNCNLKEIRKEIYERGLQSFQPELKKLKALQMDV